jgi:CubicO group peptidase (beta-lactamase class C family)
MMEAFESVHRLLQLGLEQGAYPSAAAAVGVGPELYFKRTYGACDAHTLFDLASVTKILSTTMIALRYLEEGRLRLTDAVGDFFPEAPEDKRGITVEQLMTHTGGIGDHFYFSDYTDDPEDAVKVILEHPLEQSPGGEPIYTCLGYILLGKILEQLGGAALDALAERVVFGPLGMKRTGYHPEGETAPTELDPKTGRPTQGIVGDRNARFLGGIAGNAGVFSDLEDMIVFAKMLACGGRRPDGTAQLSAETLNAAIVNRTPDSKGEFRGLGFQLAGSPGSFLGEMGKRAYGHTGHTGTCIAVDPDTGLWVVLLTNRVYPTRANTKWFALRPMIHTAAARSVSTLPDPPLMGPTARRHPGCLSEEIF